MELFSLRGRYLFFLLSFNVFYAVPTIRNIVQTALNSTLQEGDRGNTAILANAFCAASEVFDQSGKPLSIEDCEYLTRLHNRCLKSDINKVLFRAIVYEQIQHRRLQEVFALTASSSYGLVPSPQR